MRMTKDDLGINEVIFNLGEIFVVTVIVLFISLGMYFSKTKLEGAYIEKVVEVKATIAEVETNIKKDLQTEILENLEDQKEINIVLYQSLMFDRKQNQDHVHERALKRKVVYPK